ncbi:unnamed protein product [Rhizoctonia solani]|uniref:Hydrophobin n=1 Tax=Rhizoctonia solani TaxID=456999 RepID=A0A8H3EEN7_9AGAM|nr:unnamed protein product [Rhizoctonia solani]
MTSLLISLVILDYLLTFQTLGHSQEARDSLVLTAGLPVSQSVALSVVFSTDLILGNGVGISDSLTKGASLSNLGLGIGRPPSGDFSSKAATCPTGRRYCCKHVRRYDDPKNTGLLDGVLLNDSITNGLVGLTCDLIVSSLAPGSCKNAVCCTSQYNSKQGLLNLGCTLSTNL